MIEGYYLDLFKKLAESFLPSRSDSWKISNTSAGAYQNCTMDNNWKSLQGDSFKMLSLMIPMCSDCFSVFCDIKAFLSQ